MSLKLLLSAAALLVASGAVIAVVAAGGDTDDPGTIVVAVETVPPGSAGTFAVTGVPSCAYTEEGPAEPCIPAGGTLVVTDLEPGTYTTTMVDPAPDFDVAAVNCDDTDSDTASGGDAQTRTAVLNIDPGETVTCTYTVARRGTAIVAVETVPPGSAGTFAVTGVPSCAYTEEGPAEPCIPAGGTLVVTDLEPGTYTTTMVDPAPDFDVAAVNCDDTDSDTVSGGDAQTRTAVLNIDPGETVTCTYTVARRGTAIVAVETVPPGSAGTFAVTGVPSCASTDEGPAEPCIPAGGTLVVADLEPGTYTTTMVDPAPDYEITDLTCDDDTGTGLASQGDPTTRTAVFNVDPGETVTCTYVLRADTSPTPNEPGTATGGGGGGSPTEDGDAGPDGGVQPEDDDERLPLPDVLPDDTDASAIPRSGPWSVTHGAGALDCGVIVNEIPPSPPEPGTIEASDDGRRLVGSGFSGAPDPATGGEGQVVSVEFTRSPASPGRYVGSFTQDGLTVDYVAQVITSEYLVGYLFGSFSRSGVTCELYRPYVLEYAG